MILRHIQIDGNTLRALTTTCKEKSYEGTRLIAEANGKKVEDWAIRSQAHYEKVQRLDVCGYRELWYLCLRYSPLFMET